MPAGIKTWRASEPRRQNYCSLFSIGMCRSRYSQVAHGPVQMEPAFGNRGIVMRKLLLAGTAVAVVMAAGSAGAADLSRPVYKAPPPIPVFSWTGWYVGVHVGGAWGTKEWSGSDRTIRWLHHLHLSRHDHQQLRRQRIPGRCADRLQLPERTVGVGRRSAGQLGRHSRQPTLVPSFSEKPPAKPMSMRSAASRCGSAAPSTVPCCT